MGAEKQNAGPYQTDPEGTVLKYIVLKDLGTLTAATDQDTFFCQIKGVIKTVAGYATTAIFDVHKNGTTMYSTQGSRPTIEISANATSTTLPDVVDFESGDRITLDTDQIGSGTDGSNFCLIIGFEEG